MSSYIIRDIDPALWKLVKSKAALQGVTLKSVIEKFFREWVKKS